MNSFLNDIDLTNSDLWEVEYFEIVLAELDLDYRQLAIADFEIPVFRRSRIMAARFHNPVARPWWKLGCYLKQSVAAPVSIEVNRWKIPLYHHTINKEQLMFFPDSCPRVWRLTASIPHWHQEAHITVWRYIGDLPPSFLSTISVVENKVDQILQRLSNGNP
ncbi:hypothetical protein [Microseira sp. BLCC-F43]|jgi:hypothetical protein|uniref:hypothetical protein n=1 Tax=Microseira sp. BLCC-F43 TaxID=3153602 RepID=UPI0035B9DFCD